MCIFVGEENKCFHFQTLCFGRESIVSSSVKYIVTYYYYIIVVAFDSSTVQLIYYSLSVHNFILKITHFNRISTVLVQYNTS